MDSHTNFAYSTIATPPSPSSTGTSVIVQSGDGVKYPVAPFNCVVCPVDTAPLVSNAEIVRVTTKASDTFTIVRTQEGSNSRSIVVGDQIYVAITAKVLSDIESLTPVGTIHPYGGSSAPTNFLMCDGTSYLRSAYPTLFSVLGTAYGAADGTHFNVPGFQDRFPLGANTHARGAAGGSLGHTHSVPGLTVPGLSIPSIGVHGTVPGSSVSVSGYAEIWFNNSFDQNTWLLGIPGAIGPEYRTTYWHNLAASGGGANASLTGFAPPVYASGSSSSVGIPGGWIATDAGANTGGSTTGGSTTGPADPPYQAVNYIIRAT